MAAPACFIYTAAWLGLCFVALIVAAVRRRELLLFRRRYWRFLFQPWKLAFFGLAFAGIVLMAPYTGDPTWDYVDAAFMAVFAFTTAPWSLGVLARRAQGKERWADAYVALCVWMFSASWSYDGYLLLRDGMYPVTWWTNILASSTLYAFAGMFWSLDLDAAGRPTFAFLEPDWTMGSRPAPLGPVVRYALFIAVPVAALLAYFLVD